MSRHREFGHLVMQSSAQQAQTPQFHVIGYISDYDPETHSIKAYVPDWRDEDDMPQQTGWVQLGTSWSGEGWGDVSAPLTGATPEDPFKGPSVMFSIVNRDGGMHIAGVQVFNDKQKSPGDNVLGSDEKIKNGERLIQHTSGTFIYLKADGTFRFGTTQVGDAGGDWLGDIANDATLDIHHDLSVNVDRDETHVVLRDFNAGCGRDMFLAAVRNMAAGALVTVDLAAGVDMNISGEANVNITSEGLVNITAPLTTIVGAGGVLESLVKALSFLPKYDAHTHLCAGSGGTSGPPSLPSTAEDITENLQAT